MSRSTLSELRSVLRGMTEAGTADYTIVSSGGTASYWDDDQLDIVLDRHREDVINEPLTPCPIVGSGGTSLYYEYRAGHGNLEQTSGGTAVFWVQDSTYATAGTADYSMDYLRGVVTFDDDQGGSTFYYNARSYDLNAAAADIWRRKAAHAASGFSFSTDNHKVDRNQVYKHYTEMAEMYEAMGEQSVSTLQIWRSDTDA